MGDRGGMGTVKNKQAAPMQISAEQILREARERQEDENYTAPAQKITDPEVRAPPCAECRVSARRTLRRRAPRAPCGRHRPSLPLPLAPPSRARALDTSVAPVPGRSLLCTAFASASTSRTGCA